MNKIFVSLLIISFVVILGVGGYYLRGLTQKAVPSETTGGLPPAETQPSAQQATNVSSGQSTQQTSGIVLASQAQAVEYAIDKGNNVIVVQGDGKILKTSGNKSETISGNAISGFKKAYVSYDGKKVLALAGTKASVFDADQKNWTALQGSFQDAAWSPADRRVALLSVPSGGVSSVSILNADDQKARPAPLASINQQDATITWPIPSRIILGDRPSGLAASSLLALDVGKKTFSLILADRLGLEMIWGSSSVPVGLYFSADSSGRGGQLNLVDQNGAALQTLNFLTLPSKCAFYNKAATKTPTTQSTSSATSTKTTAALQQTALTLVCAVPRDQSLLQNNLLPDSYLKKSIFTSDDIIEVDVSSGNIKSLFNDRGQNIDADDVKASNQSFFFINRYDQKIYSLGLPK